MLVGKDRSLPYSIAPVKDKHSSLLKQFVNYGQKKFYNIDLSSPATHHKNIILPMFAKGETIYHI
jgi:hypothetical protein